MFNTTTATQQQRQHSYGYNVVSTKLPTSYRLW
jgi:hypothetical protein